MNTHSMNVGSNAGEHEFDLELELDGLPPKQSLTCLVLDDDHDDQNHIARLLRSIDGYDVRVDCVSSLQGAKDVLADRRFDVLMVDFWLGCETAVAFVHETQVGPNPPAVIMMSTLDDADFQEIGLKAGAFHFLSKDDLKPKTLESAVRACTHHMERRANHSAVSEQQKLGDVTGEAQMIGWARTLDDSLSALDEQAHGMIESGTANTISRCLGINRIQESIASIRRDLRVVVQNQPEPTG